MSEFTFRIHAEEHTRFGPALFPPGLRTSLNVEGRSVDCEVVAAEVAEDGTWVDVTLRGALPSVIEQTHVRCSVGFPHT